MDALQLVLRTLTRSASTRAQALSTLARNTSLLTSFLRRISTRLLHHLRGSLASPSQTLQDGAKLRFSGLNRGGDYVSDALDERLDVVICFDPTTRKEGTGRRPSVLLTAASNIERVNPYRTRTSWRRPGRVVGIYLSSTPFARRYARSRASGQVRYAADVSFRTVYLSLISL